MSYAQNIKNKISTIIQEDKATEIPKEDLFELASFFAGMSRIYLNAYKKIDPEGYEFLKNQRTERMKS